MSDVHAVALASIRVAALWPASALRQLRQRGGCPLASLPHGPLLQLSGAATDLHPPHRAPASRPSSSRPSRCRAGDAAARPYPGSTRAREKDDHLQVHEKNKQQAQQVLDVLLDECLFKILSLRVRPASAAPSLARALRPHPVPGAGAELQSEAEVRLEAGSGAEARAGGGAAIGGGGKHIRMRPGLSTSLRVYKTSQSASRRHAWLGFSSPRIQPCRTNRVRTNKMHPLITPSNGKLRKTMFVLRRGKQSGLYVDDIYGRRRFGHRGAESFKATSALYREITLRLELAMFVDIMRSLKSKGLHGWPAYRDEQPDTIRLLQTVLCRIDAYKQRRVGAGMFYLIPTPKSSVYFLEVRSPLFHMPLKQALRRLEIKKRRQIVAAASLRTNKGRSSAARETNRLLLYTVVSIFVGCVIVILP